jgi:hypothetical protein
MPYRPSAGRFLDEDDEWADHENLGWAGKMEEPKVYATGVASVPRSRAASDEPQTPVKRAPSAPPAGTPDAATPQSEEPITSEEGLLAVFNVIDADGSGTITAEELQTVLRRYVNKSIAPEAVDAMVARADSDQNGKVSISEFMTIVKSGTLGALAPGETQQSEEGEAVGKSSGKSAVKQAASYSVTVTTGTDSGASTDANVWVQLFGTTGVSPKVQLGQLPNSQKGSVDTFPLPDIKSVGDLVKIGIGHDNTGEGPGWQLAKVEVVEVRQDGVKPATFTFIAAPAPHSGAWLGGSADATEMEIDLHTEDDAPLLIPGRPAPSSAGGAAASNGGMATTGFGGNPPASLTNSVKQLETLTSEVSKIRESLLQIDRPGALNVAGDGDGAARGGRGLAPITPDRRAGAAVARPRKLKGLAGVIAARNERDKKRMDELVKLVQSSLGAMENSLEARCVHTFGGLWGAYVGLICLVIVRQTGEA